MVGGNDDRTDTAVGVVYCIEGISLVMINYMERNYCLGLADSFPEGALVGVSQLAFQVRQSTLPIPFAVTALSEPL